MRPHDKRIDMVIKNEYHKQTLTNKSLGNLNRKDIKVQPITSEELYNLFAKCKDAIRKASGTQIRFK